MNYRKSTWTYAWLFCFVSMFAQSSPYPSQKAGVIAQMASFPSEGNVINDPGYTDGAVTGKLRYDASGDVPICIASVEGAGGRPASVYAALGSRVEFYQPGGRPTLIPTEISNSYRDVCAAIVMMNQLLNEDPMQTKLKLVKIDGAHVVARDHDSGAVITGKYWKGIDMLPSEMTITVRNGAPLKMVIKVAEEHRKLTRRDMGRGLGRFVR